MRTHPKTIGNGVKIFLLLVNTVLTAPPPRLVHEWAVRGIHETDNAMVDADGHFSLQVGQFVFAAEFVDLRRGFGGFGPRGESCARRSGVWNKNPDKPVLLFAGIATRVDTIHFEVLVGSQRRDQLTLAIVDIELPTVVSAL